MSVTLTRFDQLERISLFDNASVLEHDDSIHAVVLRAGVDFRTALKVAIAAGSAAR